MERSNLGNMMRDTHTVFHTHTHTHTHVICILQAHTHSLDQVSGCPLLIQEQFSVISETA